VNADPTYKRAVFVTSNGKTNSYSFTTRLKLQTAVCQELIVEIVKVRRRLFISAVVINVTKLFADFQPGLLQTDRPADNFRN
jgi:hypothetical protein